MFGILGRTCHQSNLRIVYDTLLLGRVTKKDLLLVGELRSPRLWFRPVVVW